KTESETSYNKISDRLGESTVMVRENMELRTGDFATERVNTDRLAYVKRKRLEMSDLSSLREGQYYYVTNDKLISIQSGDPVIKTKVSEARYNQLVGLNPIPDNIQVMLKRDFTDTIARFKSNIAGAKSNPIRLDKFPNLRSIINAYRDHRSVGNTDTLTGYQKALFDHAKQDLESMTEAANQFVKDIIGPQTASADKTADDSKAGKSSDIVESRDPVKHNIDNINVSTDNAWGLS